LKFTSHKISFILLLILLCFILFFFVHSINQTSEAQVVVSGSVGTYQISGQSDECYIVNTKTGELWHYVHGKIFYCGNVQDAKKK